MASVLLSKRRRNGGVGYRKEWEGGGKDEGLAWCFVA